MTREEAIKVLNGILHLNYRNFWDEECDEAVDMAIEALKSLPSAEAVPWSVADKIGEDRERLEERVSELEERLEWIPCNERLPKECDGRVLFSKEDGEVTIGLHSEFSNVWYIGDMCGVGGSKVIAWMPLPTPYRERREP